jgi:L-glutamine-phosphate cytidylyltransferase
VKVVILAAGAGKRFRALHLPKPLTVLANGKSILEQQLETLSRFLPLDDVILVVGYRKEKVMDQFPNLLYVYNPCFAEENTAKSLLRALRKVHDDVLWINGDVVFHPSVLKATLSCGKNSMVVNKAPVGDEEVKYRTNASGRILEVSKTVAQPQGEALGLNFFTKQDLDTLKRNLDKCRITDYFEKGIELCIAENVEVWSIPVGITECAEVDFPEDLEKANKVLGGMV